MTRGLYRIGGCAALLCLLFASRTVTAQSARDALVQVTVVDPSTDVVPAATVRLLPLAPGAAPLDPALTNGAGVATFERVPPGEYIIRAEFTGFDVATLRDVRVRSGTSRHVIVLPPRTLP